MNIPLSLASTLLLLKFLSVLLEFMASLEQALRKVGLEILSLSSLLHGILLVMNGGGHHIEEIKDIQLCEGGRTVSVYFALL